MEQERLLIEAAQEDPRRSSTVFLKISGLSWSNDSSNKKPSEEIAQQFGRSEGAIKQLQFRALETLKARLGGRHE